MWKFLAGVLVGAIGVELLSDSPVKSIESAESQNIATTKTEKDSAWEEYAAV